MAFVASLHAGCVICTTLKILLLKRKLVKAVFAIILIATKLKVVFKCEFDPRRFTLDICYQLSISKDLFAFYFYVKFNKLVLSCF